MITPAFDHGLGYTVYQNLAFMALSNALNLCSMVIPVTLTLKNENDNYQDKYNDIITKNIKRCL
jgi:hypothetical protein